MAGEISLVELRNTTLYVVQGNSECIYAMYVVLHMQINISPRFAFVAPF
jgi:hypothetical protein